MGKSSSTYNTHELILAFQSGNEAAFTEIYNTFYERVLYFARRYVPETDAQDITAETFFQLWRKRADFKEIAALTRFLFITARNRCYDLLRHQQMKQQHTAALQELMEDRNDDFFPDLVRLEFVKLLQEQINQLPEKMRAIFLLSYREGLKPAEIAAQLGISVKTVSNQKLTAIKLLRTALQNHPMELLLAILIQLDRLS